MTKIRENFDPQGYATVAERVRLFYEAHPRGRIETELVSRTERDVVFKALVFRDADDERPAATGWAAEREGDGDVNLVACLENTETSAIGRALANLGFTASRLRPSAEEIAKASRRRVRLYSRGVVRLDCSPADPRTQAAPFDTPTASPLQNARTMLVSDLTTLIERAAPLGIRPARIARWKALVSSDVPSLDDLTRYERRLRTWIVRQLDTEPS